MQNEEQKLIEGLFSRLKQAESQTGARDAGAEELIKQRLQEQPGAPYYMAQAILIQEAAMKKMNDRISELEARVAPQQSSGGFLSGLFGGRQRQQPQSAWNSAPPQQQPMQQAPQQPYAAAPRGTGFLGGALQTAVGVAGGVVMADMLTSMFHHSQPEEIVNIINEPPLPQGDDNLNSFNDGGPSFMDQNSGWDNTLSDNNGFDNNGFDNNDFGGDSGFNDFDDDSFV